MIPQTFMISELLSKKIRSSVRLLLLHMFTQTIICMLNYSTYRDNSHVLSYIFSHYCSHKSSLDSSSLGLNVIQSNYESYSCDRSKVSKRLARVTVRKADAAKSALF